MDRRSRYVIAAAVVVSTGLTLGHPVAFAAAPDRFVTRLMGEVPGAGKTFACFTRHYDEAHLAVHPDQNICSIEVLAVSYSNLDFATQLRIGVKIRGNEALFTTVAECGHAKAGAAGLPVLHCAVASPGAALDLSLETKNAVRIDFPTGPNLWKPGPANPNDMLNGAFGPDDKRFRLYRTRLADCGDQALDGEEKARLKAGR